jgi:predicted aspartyl protease
MMPTMRRAVVVALTLAAVAGLAPSPLAAQIYRWVNEAGVPHYAEGLDAVPERYRAGATPLRLRNKSTPATEPDAAPGPRAPAGGTVIRYSPGRQIVTDVRINDATSARLIVDTGADHTLISRRVLTAAGVSVSRAVATGRLVGVTGSDRLPFVMIDSLEVGGIRLGRMPVGAYDVENTDGLLGRDVLDRFNVAIDPARGVVTLSPK